MLPLINIYNVDYVYYVYVKLTTSGYRIYAPLPYALAKYVNYYDQKGK